MVALPISLVGGQVLPQFPINLEICNSQFIQWFPSHCVIGILLLIHVYLYPAANSSGYEMARDP